MKKIIRMTTMILCLCMMWANVLPVFAETTTVAANTTTEEKTTEEKTTVEPSTTKKERIYITIKSEKPVPQYVYTGKAIRPEVVVTKEDGTVASESEYELEYVGDCTAPGRYGVRATYKKNGYSIEADFLIVPGTTDKINVKIKDGKVTVSWNPVPGAGVYRVYKYDEAKGSYVEMWWSDGQIASASTSRTFTKDELKPGGKYKMAIMALASINQMPTDQMAYFTVDTTKDTDVAQKPVTTEKQTLKTEKPTLLTPQPTKPGEVNTTVKEEAGTTAEEKTTIEENTTAEIKSTVDKLADAETDDDNVSEEKAPVDRTKLVLIICVSLLAIVGIVFTVYKKKR